MTGLRQTKKARTRAAILAASRELFTERGFAGATTAEIARRAGVAEGTVFNYFPSKAAILVRLVDDVFRGEFRPAPELTGTVEERLLAILDHHLAPARRVDRGWLREAYAIAFAQGSDRSYVFASLLALDQAIAEHVRAELEQLRDAGALREGADLDAFLEIAFSVAMVGFAAYLLADGLDYADVRIRMGDRIGLLVRSLLLPPDPAGNQGGRP